MDIVTSFQNHLLDRGFSPGTVAIYLGAPALIFSLGRKDIRRLRYGGGYSP